MNKISKIKKFKINLANQMICDQDFLFTSNNLWRMTWCVWWPLSSSHCCAGTWASTGGCSAGCTALRQIFPAYLMNPERRGMVRRKRVISVPMSRIMLFWLWGRSLRMLLIQDMKKKMHLMLSRIGNSLVFLLMPGIPFSCLLIIFIL